MAAKDRLKDLEQGSAMDMIAEIGKLVLLLICKIIFRIVKLIIKAVVYAWKGIVIASEKAIQFWKSTPTQAKLKLLRKHTRIFLKKLRHWLYLALVYTLRFIVLCIKGLIHGIIHLKSTIIMLGHATAAAWKSLVRTFRQFLRGRKLSHIKRKRAYRAFRKNKGFKGLLIDTANLLKGKINSYMEEEQTDTSPDAVTEDDLFDESMDEEEQNNKAHVIGRKLLSSVKNLLDEDATEPGSDKGSRKP